MAPHVAVDLAVIGSFWERFAQATHSSEAVTLRIIRQNPFKLRVCIMSVV